MTKMLGFLILAMIALAVLGFLVDAARVIAGILFVGCLIGAVAGAAMKKRAD